MTGPDDESLDERAYVVALTCRCDAVVASLRANGASADLTGLRTLVSECEYRLGAAHRQTVRLRANLASWGGELGAPAQAGTELAALWDQAARSFGPRDADTLLIACNAAAFTGIAGDPRGAVTVLEQVIDDVEAVFGPESATARMARRNLRVWRDGAEASPAGGQS
ncbi:MAG: tetratricopeptide repeat protein [Actinomycetia bacterium]|nr:tetratricopeptide repeat protein [Actinomycetes bacterium]